MKIEEAFRDLAGYLRMEGVMSKTLENAEKTLRLLAFAYALGLVMGETMRRKWREKGGCLAEMAGLLRPLSPPEDAGSVFPVEVEGSLADGPR
ncbi:hypothetical protein ACLWNE_09235 [Thermus oshimai]|uniref:hypothetical protein n=1 Tax=Thermus oshimai TaxID=56957 RepID=UPI0039A48704